MPKRADELNITCAECGGEAAYFDEARVSRALYATEKARDEHMRGFICENEPRSAKAQRLLVLAEGELMPIPDDNAAAPIITASQV
jgi:hypothetical protein